MQTSITKRGQTAIPSAIGKKYQLSEGDALIWLEDGATIKVLSVPSDPVTALRCSDKGEALNKALLEQRKKTVSKNKLDLLDTRALLSVRCAFSTPNHAFYNLNFPSSLRCQ